MASSDDRALSRAADRIGAVADDLGHEPLTRQAEAEAQLDAAPAVDDIGAGDLNHAETAAVAASAGVIARRAQT